MMMELKETAECLAELGHVTRLAIFRYLVKKGKNGVPVGDVQKELDIPASTLSHHLSRLTRVGLIEQERSGRTLYCVAKYGKLQCLIDYLVDECCDGVPCIDSSSCSG